MDNSNRSGDNCVVNATRVSIRGYQKGEPPVEVGKTNLPTNPIDALGSTLITRKDGITIPVSVLRGPNRYICLLFSAAWCAPCKEQLPLIIKFYTKFKASDRAAMMDIVFISHDNSDDQFRQYLDDMPWPAVPFSRRDIKAHLNSFLRVFSIPTLVVLESESGAVVTTEGIECIASDPDGKSFPWKPRTLDEILHDMTIIDHAGKRMRWKDLRRGYKALYFSAKWCPPCRAFTPSLITFVETLTKNTNHVLDVIFISSDRTEDSFQQYFEMMPWYAMRYGQEQVKRELCSIVGVQGIPMLVLLDSGNRIITKDARRFVNEDPTASRFPWKPKVVEELVDQHTMIVNSEPCLIIFTDGNEQEMEQATTMFIAVAEETRSQIEDKKKRPLRYFTGGEAEICDTLREYARLEDAVPLVVILDIARGIKYLFDDEWLTTENLLDFVTKFYEGVLTSMPLQKR